MATTSVGIRELKNNLSRYVARVREGETITVTDHGEEVALLVPIGPSRRVRTWTRVREGSIVWNGARAGLPDFTVPDRGAGLSAAEEVIAEREDRLS